MTAQHTLGPWTYTNEMKHTDKLIAQYFERSRKEAEAEAKLLQALRDVAQLLAWQNNGESHGYSHRILTPAHALRNAQAAIQHTIEVAA